MASKSSLVTFIGTLLTFFVFFSAQVFAQQSSRRSFLKSCAAYTVATGSGMALGSAGAMALDSLTEETSNAQETSLQNSKVSYSQTVLEQHLVLVGNRITMSLLDEAFKNQDIRFGNAGMTDEYIKELLKKPGRLWTSVTVIAPLWEEIVFRGFPGVLSAILFKDMNWCVGAGSALIFAALHNGSTSFKKYIPLPQFLLGIWFWYLAKHRGFSHALLGHMINNNTATVHLMIENMLKNSVLSCEQALKS